MAYDATVRNKLRAKFIGGMPLTAAAAACKVPYNTARTWKRQEAEQGTDWDVARNARRMTKSGLEEMANEVLGALADEFLSTLKVVRESPDMAATTRATLLVGLMDGYGKAIAAASRAMPNANRLAVAMDVVKFLTGYIAAKYPKLRVQFNEITEAAGPDFVREFGNAR